MELYYIAIPDLFYTQVLRQSVVIQFYFRPFRYSVVPRLSHASLFWSAAGGGETGRQNWANLQALLGRGQERQRGTVVRGLLVSHAQGDPPASQLGLQIPTIPCVTPLLPGFTLTLFGGGKKALYLFFKKQKPNKLKLSLLSVSWAPETNWQISCVLIQECLCVRARVWKRESDVNRALLCLKCTAPAPQELNNWWGRVMYIHN